MEYDSNYSLAKAIGDKLGLDTDKFDSTYSILEAILPLVGTASGTYTGGDGIKITNGVIDFSDAFENWIESVENRFYEI